MIDLEVVRAVRESRARWMPRGPRSDRRNAVLCASPSSRPGHCSPTSPASPSTSSRCVRSHRRPALLPPALRPYRLVAATGRSHLLPHRRRARNRVRPSEAFVAWWTATPVPTAPIGAPDSSHAFAARSAACRPRSSSPPSIRPGMSSESNPWSGRSDSERGRQPTGASPRRNSVTSPPCPDANCSVPRQRPPPAR